MASKTTYVDWGGLTPIVNGIRVGATKPGQTGTELTGAEIILLDGITAGTASASKALVVDSSLNLTALNNLSMTGDLTVDGAAGTGTATPGLLKLTTPETTIVALDQLGRVEFSAPLEASGTDAILVSAMIWAEAMATFDATTNTTDLVFALGESETATEKYRITAKGGVKDTGPVVIPDATPYTVLAANSGRTHPVVDQGSSITINLPAVSAGLKYEFWYAGAAADAQDWAIVAAAGAFYKGGVVFMDQDGDVMSPVYANGSSHLTINVVKPEVGTRITVHSDGTSWYLTGNVFSVTTPTIA